jgi:AcrR family transcriptional regulator
VDAGLELARAKGPDGVVLREVARRVGVSHNAAYRHFADRDELLLEIADRGMTELSRAMQARLDALPDELDAVSRARRRLQEVGRGYVDFALAEEGLFAAAFSCFAGKVADGSDPESGPYELLTAALDDLVEVGYLDTARRPGAEVACWAAVHGFSLLHLEGPLRGVAPADREAALTGLLDTIDRGLGRPVR